MRIRRLALLALLVAPLFAQHVYWRLDVQASSSGDASIGQWVSYDSGGSTISTSGGTATASSCYTGCGGSFGPSNAFNGTTNCSTFWLGSANHDQLEMQFSSAVAIDHISITAGCNGGRGPIVLLLQYSDNNSTWTTANTWNGAGWPTTRTLSFTPANAEPPVLGIAWRINATTPTTSCLGFVNLSMKDSGGSSISLSRYAATASSTYGDPYAAYSAIDAGGSTYFYNSSGNNPQQWRYDFPTIQTLGSITFGQAAGSGCPGPTAFSVQYSYDGSTWSTPSGGSFSGVTWSGLTTQTFTISGGPASAAMGPWVIIPN
jgi:hypothetical protein